MPETKHTTITVTYSVEPGASAPNECKATANYQSVDVIAFGGSWTEARNNIISRCKQLDELGDAPPTEEIDLDTV